jgi:hypothetical protein
VKGRKISEKNAIDFINETPIELGSIQSGVYFIKINADDFSTTKKIIIQ